MFISQLFYHAGRDLNKREKLSHSEQNKNTQPFQKTWHTLQFYITPMENFYYILGRESYL